MTRCPNIHKMLDMWRPGSDMWLSFRWSAIRVSSNKPGHVLREERHSEGLHDNARTTYKIALQEHNAALDVAGLKYEDLCWKIFSDSFSDMLKSVVHLL